MPERTWRQRLQQAADRDGRSLRAISIAAEQAENALWELLNTDKEPGIARVQAICAELNVSISYIMEGIELTPESERLLKAWSRMTKDEREAFLQFVESRRNQR